MISRNVLLVFLSGLLMGVGLERFVGLGGRSREAPIDVPADSVNSVAIEPVTSTGSTAVRATATPAGSPPAAGGSPPGAARTLSPATRDSLVRRRDELIRNFKFNEDQIHGGGWYRHTSQLVDDRYDDTYLRAPVSAAGRIYLESNYYGRSWIFHTRLVARLGDRVIESDPVPTRDQQRETGSAGVFETITFNRASDGGLLEELAASANRGVAARVRLLGEYTREYVVSERDQKALSESVELASILRRVGAPAPSTDKTLFVGDLRFGIYFVATCLEARAIPTEQRREFIGHSAARAGGFVPSSIASCRADSAASKP